MEDPVVGIRVSYYLLIFAVHLQFSVVLLMKSFPLRFVYLFSGLICLAIASPAQAGNNAHLNQLLNGKDKKCDNCDLSGFNLSQLNLSGASLVNANLSGADLGATNLRQANLSGANISSAQMYRVDLVEANLSRVNGLGVDLKGAHLHKANLTNANLRNADLARANLMGVTATGIKLEGANLAGAHILMEDFREVDLNGVTMPDGKSYPRTPKQSQPATPTVAPQPTTKKPTNNDNDGPQLF